MWCYEWTCSSPLWICSVKLVAFSCNVKHCLPSHAVMKSTKNTTWSSCLSFVGFMNFFNAHEVSIWSINFNHGSFQIMSCFQCHSFMLSLLPFHPYLNSVKFHISVQFSNNGHYLHWHGNRISFMTWNRYILRTNL